MRHTATTITAVALLALTTACTSSNEKQPATVVTVTAPAAGAPDSNEGGKTAELPNFTGEVLQNAQDGAQAAGFWVLDSTDATGMGRVQVLDRNWTVCSQDPAPGMHDVTTVVTFATVKLTETCP